MAGRRGYAKLKNDFYLNGKVKELRVVCPSAVGAFVFAIAYCSDNLTDGRIPDRDLRYVLGVTDEEINALYKVELLEPDGNSGYVIHDYTEHNSRRDQVEKSRERNAENYRKRRFNRDSTATHRDESELNRTKHKNTRTQEHLPDGKSPNPPTGADADRQPVREPSSDETAQFRQFWSLYPNHDYPDAAVREFKRVLRRTGTERVNLVALLQGAQMLRDEQRDPRYIPAASKWLHDGGWKNKPKPRARQPDRQASRAQQNQDANAALIARYAQEEIPQIQRKEIPAC